MIHESSQTTNRQVEFKAIPKLEQKRDPSSCNVGHCHNPAEYSMTVHGYPGDAITRLCPHHANDLFQDLQAVWREGK